MQIHYQILAVVPEDRQVIVRYYTDRVTPADLATHVEDGRILRTRTDLALGLPIPTPTGEALHELIMQSAPRDYLAMREAMLDGDPALSVDVIEAEVGKEFSGPPPSFEELKAARLEQLAKEYHHCLVSGFTSDALGAPHRYKSDLMSQIWLTGATLAQQDRAYECIDANGVAARRMHTTAQLLQVLRDGAALAESYKDEYMSLVEQIQAATTQAELDAIPHMVPR